MFRNTLAALAVLTLAASSQAGVIVTSEGSPTVGLPGFTTYTLTATSNGGPIQGFDFASQAAFGLFGPMNQVNPFGVLPTIFADNNAAFVGVPADVSADSQFKFLTSAVTVPAGFASESNTQLRAVFAAAAPLGQSVAFAQLAIPNAGSGTVQFMGQIQTVEPTGVADNNVQGVVPIPEPASLALVGLALLGLVGYRRRK